jgi:hypothetical protein
MMTHAEEMPDGCSYAAPSVCNTAMVVAKAKQ